MNVLPRCRSSHTELSDASTTTIYNRHGANLSGVHDPPQLHIVALALGPGDGLKVLCLRQICLKEPPAAGLLNSEERTTKVEQVPQLSGVILLQASDHAVIETRDLVCVEEAAAGDLLDAMQAALYLRQNPALRVVVLEGPGHDVEIALLDLMRIKEAWADGLYDCDNPCAFLIEVGVSGRGVVLMDTSVIAI